MIADLSRNYSFAADDLVYPVSAFALIELSSLQ